MEGLKSFILRGIWFVNGFGRGYNRGMIHQLEATYEQEGVLRLAHPLPLANQQPVQVSVEVVPGGRWAAVDLASGDVLLYAETVGEARDRGRALGRGEPLIRWVGDEPELPSAGL